MSGGHEPQQQSSGAWTIALALIAVFGVLMLVCCGGLGLVGGLVYTRVGKATAEMQQAARGQPAPVVQAWDADVIARLQLARAYTAALDAVATDQQVLEKLGEPIETLGGSDELFRREKTTDWDGSDETIEFDLRGPKGPAKVRVVAGLPTGSAPPHIYGRGAWPKSITVVLEDETEIVVAVPGDMAVPGDKEEP